MYLVGAGAGAPVSTFTVVSEEILVPLLDHAVSRYEVVLAGVMGPGGGRLAPLWRR